MKATLLSLYIIYVLTSVVHTFGLASIVKCNCLAKQHIGKQTLKNNEKNTVFHICYFYLCLAYLFKAALYSTVLVYIHKLAIFGYCTP